MLGRDGAVQRVTAEYQFVATTEDAIRIWAALKVLLRWIWSPKYA